MKIPKWHHHNEQECYIGRHTWSVAWLIELSRDLPVMEIPLDHLNIYHKYTEIYTREMVMHIRAVLDADLSHPIILDEDGELMDGRHRIMRALLDGAETIKAVRFDENPSPCRVKDD